LMMAMGENTSQPLVHVSGKGARGKGSTIKAGHRTGRVADSAREIHAILNPKINSMNFF
jgi:hypothetical protein